MKKVRIIIVGGGLAGLMATIKIAEMEQEVDLFSIVPVRRSHSVCAQGGINAAIDQKGTGDSPWEHFYDTIYGGDFLANQPPVLRMCEMGPATWISAASAARNTRARHSRAPRPDNSCFTRWTNRCGGAKWRDW